MDPNALSELAPSGPLRAGINLSNFLLVTGKAASGDPIGVAPDMARAIADRLGVAVSYVTFASPGELTDAAGRDVWDIGLIAAEPARAKTIAFTPPYVEIEATYMVPEGSSLDAIDDVDRPGIRIAVSDRSAYDLYLTRHLKHAELVRAKGLAAAFELFVNENLDALAGLRPGLIADADTRLKLRGARILNGAALHGRPAGGGHRDHQPCGRSLPGQLRRGGQGEWTYHPSDRSPRRYRPSPGRAVDRPGHLVIPVRQPTELPVICLVAAACNHRDRHLLMIEV